MPSFVLPSSGGGPNTASSKLDAILDEKDDGDGGFLGSLKKIGGHLLDVLDMGRASVVAGGTEALDALSAATGGKSRIQNTDKVRQTGVSWSDIKRNFDNRIGFGDLTEADTATKNLPLNAKRALGLAGDIAADPTNLLTFGSGSVAKEGIAKTGQVLGDDVARQAIREGGVQGLRDALAEGGHGTLEDILARDTGNLGKVSAEDRIANQITDMDRNAKGGLGFAGHRTGLGQNAADRIVSGVRGSELGQAIRPLFNPTAKVADEFGERAGSVVDNVIHSASQTRRTASLDGARDIIGALDEEGVKSLHELPRGSKLSFIRDKADEIENARRADINTERLATKDAATQGLADAKSRLTTEGPATRAGLTDAKKSLTSAETAERQAGRRAESAAAAAEKAAEKASDPELIQSAVHNRAANDRLVAARAKASTLQEAASAAAEEASTATSAADQARDLFSNVKTSAGQTQEDLRAGLDSAKAAVREAPETLSDAKGVWDANVQAKVHNAVVDGLKDSAPELLSDVPKEGWVDLGNGFHVPPAVHDALQGAVSASPSELVKAIDVATNVLKRYTTLGPLNAIPHVSRNIFSNMLFAGMYGGVKTLKPWAEAGQYRKILQTILKDGEEVSAKTLAEHGLDAAASARAMALHNEGLAGRGGHLFDDVANYTDDVGKALDGEGKASGRVRSKVQKVTGTEGTVGTRTASKVNEWHEELSRGAVFLQGLDEGLSPAAAAQKSRKAMLDYSQEGLTKFERDKLARIVFFYKFPRRAVPAGVKFTIEHPGAANIASKAGLGVGQGKRNQYGDVIGPSFDTPLESAFGTVADFVKSPGDAAASVLHPAIVAVGDPKKRGLTDLIPPLDQAKSRLEEQGTGDRLFAPPLDRTGTQSGALVGPGGGLLGPSLIPGVRVGKDYDARDNSKAKDKFSGTGKPLYKMNSKERLTLAAEQAGVENPYSMSEKKLLIALNKKGVKRDVLLALLR